MSCENEGRSDRTRPSLPLPSLVENVCGRFNTSFHCGLNIRSTKFFQPGLTGQEQRVLRRHVACAREDHQEDGQ